MSEVDEGSGSTVASHRIAETVRERILSGRLKPGTRILQDELAEELNASRLPVREALRILQSRGLVTLRSNRGAWVTSLDQRDCELNYKIRERLEPLLLAESMRALTADDIEELSGIQDRIEATEDVEEFLRLDRQLHWASYRRHDAQELAAIIARLWDTTQHYRRAYTKLAGRDQRWIINSEHRLLIAAIGHKDTEMAQRILAMHISRTQRELSLHPDIFAS
ncbi:GntR family transcriptional regulator [Streptosporangium lutulentum]|uniref:DNA-binding GntR family transcriptional regulator n=1 Tax=Streptosporangium lutulentum TaxID=1461250 RepID=A0ABT9Q8H0_9ACTN|nr:GntR family transcriptional regulator [Streptosporangium lutulentum]MDP9843029.1 DNA-binding GntR family transcriptional regulator [Streptosporangium lutulentum]